MRTNNFSEITYNFLSACKIYDVGKDDKILRLDIVLKTLPHIHKKPKLVYEVLIPKSDGWAETSDPYARNWFAKPLEVVYDEPKGKIGFLFGTIRKVNFREGNYPIMESVNVDFTPEGIWEYILLENLKHHLPKVWHANYLSIKYILDEDEYPKIAHIKEYLTSEGDLHEDYEKEAENKWYNSYKESGGFHHYPTADDLVKAISYTKENKLPCVTSNEDGTISARYYIWSEWSGLRLIRYSARKSDDGSVILEKISDDPVFKYDCGVKF